MHGALNPCCSSALAQGKEPRSLLASQAGPSHGCSDDQQPESQQRGFTFPAQRSLTPIRSLASHQEKRTAELFPCSCATHHPPQQADLGPAPFLP